jgi:hypothetical protein
MDDHNEQYHAFTNHPVILPPRFTAQVTGLPTKRKSGEGCILTEKGQYIHSSPFGSLGGASWVFVEYSLFVLKIHSFPHLRFIMLVIKYFRKCKSTSFLYSGLGYEKTIVTRTDRFVYGGHRLCEGL